VVLRGDLNGACPKEDSLPLNPSQWAAAGSYATMGLPEIVVYSKPSCCLCEKAKAQLAELREKYEFAWREVNILADRGAYERFKDEIPVIFVNGRKAFKYHLDERKLLRLLKAAPFEDREDSASTSHPGR
jgi:glutaredoxin